MNDLNNCASHSRYFSDELDAQIFYPKENICLFLALYVLKYSYGQQKKQQNLRKQLSGKNKNADNIQLWCRITKTEYPDPTDTGDLPFCCQLSDWDLCAGM